MTLWFRSLHPFRGDASASQLSFGPGTILAVDDPKQANVNGWACGMIQSTGQKGWFPVNHVQQVIAGAPPVAVPVSTRQQQQQQQRQDVFSLFGGADSKSYRHGAESFPLWGAVDNDNDDEFGFGGEIMGGQSATSGSSVSIGGGFGSTLGAPVHVAVLDTTNGSQQQQQQQRGLKTGSEGHRLQNVGRAFSTATSRTTNVLSNAVSKTGHAISNAAKSTASATKQAFNETGHRLNDVQDQRQISMNQNASITHYPVVSSKTASGHQQTTTTVAHQKTIAPSSGIFTGQCTDTSVVNQQSATGGSQQVITSTSRPSGGFYPGIRGKTTTRTTVTRDASGNPCHVQTETQSRGGFFIIPMGPIGLAAAGALAAKHAYDSHNDKKKHPNDNK